MGQNLCLKLREDDGLSNGFFAFINCYNRYKVRNGKWYMHTCYKKYEIIENNVI